MSIDIAKSIFRNLGQEGVILSQGLLRSLQIAYLRVGQDTISHYEHDAAINNLIFDRHQEGMAVEMFAKAIMIAGEEVGCVRDAPFPSTPAGASRTHSTRGEVVV